MKISLKDIYLFILSISMCISMYVFSFLDNLPIIYIILMLFSILFIVINIKNNNKSDCSPLIVTFIFIFISSINFLFSNKQISFNNIIGLGKLLVWGLILSFSTIYLDKNKVINNLYHISKVVTIYLFIQSVFYYGFSISLSNVFDFGVIKYKTLDMGTLTSIYRPSSFFAEPIDYSNFILVCLILALFDPDFKNTNNKKVVIILYILGILLSASTTILFMMLLIGLIYLLKLNRKKIKNNSIILIVVVVSIIIILFNFENILLNSGAFGKTLYDSIHKIQYFSTSSRIGGSYSKLSSLNPLRMAFGYGIGNEYYLYGDVQQYMNTITRTIFQYGMLGVFIILIYFMRLFKKSKSIVPKILILIVFIECFTSNILFSISNIFIFSIVYLYNNYERERVDKL